MKQLTYIIAFVMLLGPAASAKTPGLTKPVLVMDVMLHTTYANNAVQVNWQATNTAKVRRYQLEKSADGENFSYMVSFSGTEKNYTVADNNLFAGANYYRIKLVDEAGNVLYSNTEIIDTKTATSKINILPTQLDDDKILVWVPANTSISCAAISSADGKTQRKAVQNRSSNTAAVEVKGLAAGVYNLCLQTSKGETIKLKFSRH